MSVYATVIIPTYNGQEYIGEILKMLFRQETDFEFEVLVIDSGSKDNTLPIVQYYQQKFTNLRLREIPNSEFGHGKTRNLAAKLAKGEFLLYLSHDAIPAHTEWLAEMLRPFNFNEKVVAVFGKQDPRAKCFPLMKYDIQRHFSKFGPDNSVTLFQKIDKVKDQAILDFLSFYSDVNSATRRDFLLHTIPYQDVPYSEDQLFGRDVIDAGYIKAYAPNGNVQHSNDISLSEYRMRMFDETVGLRRIGHALDKVSVFSLSKHVIKGSLKDTVRILRDPQYSLKRKLYWLVLNPLFHIERWRGIRSGSRVDLLNHEKLNVHSLEAKKKQE